MKKTSVNPDFLKILQISDTHLFADEKETLNGVNTYQAFKDLITHLNKTELHDTDLIYLTGDLSQDETSQSYEKIVALLDPLDIPIYWIPGNHDNLETLEATFKKGHNFFNSRRLSTIHWNFIFLNTQLDGTPEGFLNDKELQALRAEMESPQTSKLTAIVMHHHPIEVNTPLIDKLMLKNKDAFWDIVSNTNVKLIICGHVHGDYQFQHQNIFIETSPASCYQFVKQTTEFAMENKIGCKFYKFDEEGFTSSVVWC
jgi:Icc protein